MPIETMNKSATGAFGRAGLCIVVAYAGASLCVAQNPQPLVQGTPVTGQCQGKESEPACVLPNLFGPQGLSLFATPQFAHYAHFIGPAQTTLNQTLSSAIATQLAILPIISPSSGFTYKYDSSSGAFVRTTTSFGPIYAERAETVGRGKFSAGVSYQRFRFSDLDGINVHNVPAVFSHVPDTGPGNSPELYEADVIQTKNNISLNMDTTTLYGTVGLTDRVDVSVSIPIVSVRMSVASDAAIIRVSGATTFIPGVGTIPNPHQFTADPNSLTNTYFSKGSAAGIGDVTFRIKGNVWRDESMGISFGLDVRTPTGSAMELLGSGAAGIKPFVALSGTRNYFAPHINLGYEWNGASILAGDVTGSTISENSAGAEVIQNGAAIKHRLPSLVFYTIGTEIGAGKNLTFSVDYLGQAVVNAPRVFRETFVTQNIPGGTGALSLPTISGGRDTVVLSTGSAGLKYNLAGNLLLTTNILFRLDNKGLRQNITPLIALSYAFGK
jgi:Putative MetA-pathway of phenol degradation